MPKMMGPAALNHAVKHAIQTCWMMLPDDKKSVEEVEKQVPRVVNRAFEAMREDAQAFGLADQQP